MDTKLYRAMDILDAMSTYFQGLENYLKQTDHDKYDAVERGIEECRGYKRQFESLKLDDEGMFRAVHIHSQMRKTLQRLYENLDFKLPVGEEISKTRAYRLSEVFNKITAIYRTYIRDVAAEASEIVREAHSRLGTHDPSELQRYWQKWPGSVDLYTLAQTTLLDESYNTKNVAARTQILEILERDKRFILGEEEWISPFLTFNCVPWTKTPRPTEWAEVAAELEQAGVRPRRDNDVIIVERCQGRGPVHLLPKAMEWGPGVTESDIHNTLYTPEAASGWQWDIKIHDQPDTKQYLILECMGDDLWRVLTPWKFARAETPREMLVNKIKSHAFGRPQAYHSQIERALRQQLSGRVAVISTEAARSYDVSLGVLRVTSGLMDHIKKSKGDIYTRLDNEELDRLFETAVLEELSKHNLHLLDAVLYWVDWSKHNFRRDLDAAAEKIEIENPREWNDLVAHRVEKCVHHAVDAQLRKSSNVFQDLLDKQHKIDEVRVHTVKRG